MAKLIDLKSGLDLEDKQRIDEINEDEDFASRVLNSSIDGIFAFDRNYLVTLWNPAMERITGLSKARMIGQRVFDALPFLIAQGKDLQYKAVLEGHIMISELYQYDVPETGRKGFATSVRSPLYDETGQITGGLCVIRDQSLDHQVELADQASLEILETLDRPAVIEKCMKTATELFGGGCTIRLITPGVDFEKGIERYSANVDPVQDVLFKKIHEAYPVSRTSEYGPVRVMRTGLSEYIPLFSNERWVGFAYNEEHLRWLCELGLRSYFCVPLIARNQILGSIAIFSSKRFFMENDVKTAEAFARRCAIALDNARLFAEAAGRV